MGLLSKTVKIKITGNMREYYEAIGYNVPIHYDKKQKKTVVDTKKLVEVSVDDLPKTSKAIVKCQCDDCKKIMDITYSLYNHHDLSKGFFCKHCSHKNIMSGEKHPNWDFSLSDEERYIKRNYPEYSEFIKKVLFRDNFTCLKCGKHDHNSMEVHHLNGYNWNIAGRLDPNNATCLCKKCHKNFHSLYGNKHSTKNQFEEWLNRSIDDLGSYDGELIPARQVMCLDDHKIYKSCLEAAREYHCDPHQINYCCNQRPKHLSCQGRHFLWYDIARNMSDLEIEQHINNLKPTSWKRIRCVTTGVVFDNAKLAADYYKMKSGNKRILQVCGKPGNYAGVDPVTGEKLYWEFAS